MQWSGVVVSLASVLLCNQGYFITEDLRPASPGTWPSILTPSRTLSAITKLTVMKITLPCEQQQTSEKESVSFISMLP